MRCCRCCACDCLQVLRSIAFMHSLGLIHSDLKPENILIKSYSRYSTVLHCETARFKPRLVPWARCIRRWGVCCLLRYTLLTVFC